MKEAFFLSAVDNLAATLSIVGMPTPNGAIVNYKTLPGNNPQTNGNHVYVWQTTSNIVPWNKTPDGDDPVPTDDSSSTMPVNFPFETGKGYIVGYAVAASPNAVCATVYMPAGKLENPTDWQYDNVSVNVTYFGSNLVQVHYRVLTQYKPGTNKNWLGLWLGDQVPWSGDPMKVVNISADSPTTGYANVTGVQLLIGNPYVVGYFMVDPKTGRTSLAASSSFTVGTTQKT